MAHVFNPFHGFQINKLLRELVAKRIAYHFVGLKCAYCLIEVLRQDADAVLFQLGGGIVVKIVAIALAWIQLAFHAIQPGGDYSCADEIGVTAAIGQGSLSGTI